MAKNKYTKIGFVKTNEKGPYVQLGSSKEKNSDYNFTVELVVKNNAGEVVLKKTNGFLSLFDPRKAPWMTEERLEHVPKNLKFEVVHSEKVEE